MRRLSTLNRHQYSVIAPGSLWHIDGNQKLIRYFTGEHGILWGRVVAD